MTKALTRVQGILENLSADPYTGFVKIVVDGACYFFSTDELSAAEYFELCKSKGCKIDVEIEG